MDSVATEEVDLVIVGGGPTGLLCAVLARRLGLSVSVIDDKSSTLPVGRADGLNARTQQYLQIAKVLYDLQPKGIKCNTSSTFANGAFQSRQSSWWTSLEHCLEKNMLIVGQPEIEKVLLQKLRTERSADAAFFRFDHRATSISEDADGVTVKCEHLTDSSRRVVTRAKYAIGADGARSMVRQALDIGFEGTQPEMVWAALDTFLDTDFPVCPEIISLQLDGQCRVLWIPRERKMARFYIRLLDGREITQEAAEETIRAHMAPYRVEFVRTEWFGTFEVKERIASSFITKQGRGRIFLAGDAAHCHSVNGAQGLNTGIADAFGLIWRISLACQYREPISAPNDQGESSSQDDRIRTIMESYDIERRAVAQNAVKLAATLVRDTRHDAKQYVATIAKNAGYITGMGVNYDRLDSPLVVQSERGIWKAGNQCPDLELTTCFTSRLEPGEIRLYAMVTHTINYGSFLLLDVGTKSHDPYAFYGQHPRQFIKAVHLVCPSTAAAAREASGSNDSWLIKPELEAFESEMVMPEDSFTVVVRPDMYIGYVGDKEGVMAYLTKVLG
ncbi:hypothetical protein PG993_007059 [Apiospora rasikravindrae]|uniref:FAD-binding domain-containing protein n=1 Tax=Apiospora rasikravindrae TaxID=990691 RepID=A0ABR1SWG9_9PEZI